MAKSKDFQDNIMDDLSFVSMNKDTKEPNDTLTPNDTNVLNTVLSPKEEECTPFCLSINVKERQLLQLQAKRLGISMRSIVNNLILNYAKPLSTTEIMTFMDERAQMPKNKVVVKFYISEEAYNLFVKMCKQNMMSKTDYMAYLILKNIKLN